MEMILYLILAANIAVLLYLAWKIRKIHLFCWTLKDEAASTAIHTIRNLESLDYLYRKLQFEKPLPQTMGFAGSPDFLRLITDYALQEKVNNILECSSGISTIVLAQALKQKGRGHVYSLENDAEYAEVTRNNLQEYGLNDWATVIVAPLTEHLLNGKKYNWYDITDKIPEIYFDGLIIDGPPWSVSENARYPAGPILFSRLAKKAHIFLDDFIRPDEQKAVEVWLTEHPDMILRKHRFIKGCAELIAP